MLEALGVVIDLDPEVGGYELSYLWLKHMVLLYCVHSCTGLSCIAAFCFWSEKLVVNATKKKSLIDNTKPLAQCKNYISAVKLIVLCASFF